MGNFSGKKILLAEDEDCLITALKSWFEYVEDFSGASILVAKTAEEAESVILKELPELILLDLGLGDGIHGLNVLRNVIPRIPRTCKIFVYSAYDEYEKECLEVGAVAFIEKGMKFSQMNDLFKKYLKEE